MLHLRGRKGTIYLVKEKLQEYPVPNSKLDQAFFEVSVAEEEDEPHRKFLVKRVMFPSRIQAEIFKFIQEVSKLGARPDFKQYFKLLDYVEKDNRIYLFQEYSDLSRFTEHDQVKEINMVNVIREIAHFYNELPNMILRPMGLQDLGIKELNISHVIYDKKNYNIMVDIFDFSPNLNNQISVEPNLEHTHMRALGEVIVQLLFKRPKGKQTLNEIFDENDKKEDGVHITNLMKNLIKALFSRNPPSWEKFVNHPLLNANTDDADYETWKNEFVEDENGNEVEKAPEENQKYNVIKNHLMRLDSLNDIRICLLKSEVMEQTVRLFLFLILKCIGMHDMFIEDFAKQDLDKKKTIFLKQMRLRLQELKVYYGKILKKDFDDMFKDSQNPSEWFVKLNEVEFNLDIPAENNKEWLPNLQKQLKEDVEKIFEFLKKENSELSKEKKNYLELID